MALPRTCARTGVISAMRISAGSWPRSDAPLNLEMAATEEMTAIAVKPGPHACCIVPERREEITTEGGLDAAGGHDALGPMVRRLLDAAFAFRFSSIPSPGRSMPPSGSGRQLWSFTRASIAKRGWPAMHAAAKRELDGSRSAAELAAEAGIEVHAGHGLDYETAAHLAALPQIRELNIGHFIIGEAVFVGLPQAIARMREAIAKGVAQRPFAEAARRAATAAASAGSAMIIGIGSDLIDIRRIEKAIERYGDRFLDRIFTETERAEIRSAAPPAPRPTPSASPQRKPAPRRSARG